MTNTIKLHIDEQASKSKPKNSGTITKRITNTVKEVTPAELAQLVGQEGHTVVLSTMKGKRNQDNMIQQQALFLDFDNSEERKDKSGQTIMEDDGEKKNGKAKAKKFKVEGDSYQTIESILASDYVKEHAAFVYKTFSYEENWVRFRVAFILDKPLTTKEEVKGAYKHLTDKYPNADTIPTSPASLFFGGKELIEIDYNNVLKTEGLPVADKSKYKKEITNPNVPAAPEVAKQPKEEIPTWMLIKQGKKEVVADRLSVYGNITLPDDMSCIQYIKSLPMADLLGITTNPFHDILKTETNPSASIWQPQDSNTWIYSQLNNPTATGAKSYNIIQIVQNLLSKNSKEYPYGLAIDYLIEVIGVTIEVTEQIAELRKAADRFKEVLLSDAFKTEHPEMYQIFGRYNYTHHVNSVIDIYKMNTYEGSDGQVRLLTRMTTPNMAKRLNVTLDKATHLMGLLSFTHIADKLHDSVIPAELLKEIEHNRDYFWDSKAKKWEKRSKQREYRTSIIALNDLMENFSEIEERCVVLVKYGFNRKTQNREFALRAFGKKEADRLFPQDTGRTISKKSEAFEIGMVKHTMKTVEKHGYISTKRLKDDMRRKWKSKGYTDRRYSQCIGSMLEMYELEKVPLSNALIAELNVKGMSAIGGAQIIKKVG